jgi:hypothetical protein
MLILNDQNNIYNYKTSISQLSNYLIFRALSFLDMILNNYDNK